MAMAAPPRFRMSTGLRRAISQVNPSACRVLTLQKWDRLYAATLGIVDNINVLAVRDGNLNPLPFGTPLIANANMQAYDMYVQDTWRFKPSLTLTYGLSYGWQTPPHEARNEQTFIVDAATSQILTAQGYINSKKQAALNGQAFNPVYSLSPHRQVWTEQYLQSGLS